MHVGLQVFRFDFPQGAASIRPLLKQIVLSAEEAQFYSLWVMDHFFQMEMPGVGPAENPMLEGYTTLGYFAALTEKIKLGTLVTGVVYRHPGILAKTITTLDVLAGGRTYLGIGAAWYEKEALGLGVPFPPVKDRFEQLEETLQITKQMWSETVAPFEGKHFQLAQTLNHPQPIHLPKIMIGGGGEQKTLRLVAKYADACNLFVGMGMDAIRSKLDVLKERCDEIGRDYNTVEKTALGSVNLSQQSPKEVITQCQELAKLGIQHVIFNMPNAHEITPLETFKREIIPALRDL
jgi:F420-dependent oxidoreductase-like protein